MPAILSFSIAELGGPDHPDQPCTGGLW